MSTLDFFSPEDLGEAPFEVHIPSQTGVTTTVEATAFGAGTSSPGTRAPEAADSTVPPTTASETTSPQTGRMEQTNNLCDENTNSLNSIFFKYDDLPLAHTSEVKGVDEKITAELEKLREDYKLRLSNLENQNKYLQQQEDKLKEKECKIQKEKKKLELMETQAFVFLLQLANKCRSSVKETDDIKREINMLHKRRAELEEQLNAKSFENLQREITQLEIALRVIKDEDSMDPQEKLKYLQTEIREIEEHIEYVLAVSRSITLQIQQEDIELQDARQELINGLKTYYSSSHIYVKKMGLLDRKPFFAGCRATDNIKDNAKKFASVSKSLVEDPNWHPFKEIKTECGIKEILDEEDEKIVKLKAQCNEEEYDAVVAMMNVRKEYCLRGRHLVEELWNDREKRKASLKEGIEYILEEWKSLKRQKV